uniref:Cytochrome P450 n=1 Tax=Arcella intermedia TaxID=1963864 RepID=A0A6B2LLR2_9EUKA
MTTRIASKDIPYKDQMIPKGTLVGIAVDAIHNHPDYWEHPERFDPTRFAPEMKKGRHKFAYLPFSLGQRQCIGNTFSEIEQRLFLVRLVQKFKVLPPKLLPPKDLTRSTFIFQTNCVNISLQKR